jgi:FAD-dependent urate hydroxylase
MSDILDTAVVGAGPYGLSVAAHAAARGGRVRVFGTPMQAWDKHMPVGMNLKSEPWASDLSDPAGRRTLRAYCQERGLPYEHAHPVPVEDFVAYGRWFQQAAVTDVDETPVASVRRDGTLFAVELENEHVVRARSVVLAAGFLPFPRIPETLAELPPTHLSHSSRINELTGFAGQSVAIVGAGQSAIETAVLLSEAGARVSLIVRAPALKWNDLPEPLDRSWRVRARAPHTGLGVGWRNKIYADAPGLFRRLPADRRAEIVRTKLGPAGSWWLRERFPKTVGPENGESVFCGTTITAAKADGPRIVLDLAGPLGWRDRIEVDHVIAATGFEVRAGRMTVLAESLRAEITTLGAAPDGPPQLGASFQTSVPGLFAVGLVSAPMFGPAMRFVFGCGFTARRVARALPR